MLLTAAACLPALLVQQAISAPGTPAPKSVLNAPECGGVGFTKIIVPHAAAGFGCVHTAADTLESLAVRARPGMPATSVQVPPKCYGDGQTGPRLQLIYGYSAGDPNRSKTVVPVIQKTIAPRMEAIIQAASGGKDLGIRFAMTKGCKAIDVRTVQFPRDVLYGGNVGNALEQFTKAIDYLHQVGLNRNDRKYQIIWDGWAKDGTCGLGLTSVTWDMPEQVNPHNGLPTVGGYTDPGSALRAAGAGQDLTADSMIWGHVFGKHGPSCWGTGRSEDAGAEVHEFFHDLSAVQLSAPHSNKAGHCLDVPSVMCYGAGVFYVAACDHKPVPVLDCGQDDYWNPNPDPGSYMDTHANIARSQFFGPQPADYFALLPVTSPL